MKRVPAANDDVKAMRFEQALEAPERIVGDLEGSHGLQGLACSAAAHVSRLMKG